MQKYLKKESGWYKMIDAKSYLSGKYGQKYDFSDLLLLIKLLRSKDGCPWDREQTHLSIRKNFIEETYEALEAIDTNNIELLCEELGDVLLQVGLHVEMEDEVGNFTMEDVTTNLCTKLIMRHPHIFGDLNVSDAEGVLNTWEDIKKQTKGYTTETEALRSVPITFPALMRAQKVQKKASKIGFDWPDIEGSIAKIEEELAELKAAIANGDKAEINEEMGDLLFSAVNISRKLKIDAEECLTEASAKYVNRFEKMENLAIAIGSPLAELSLEEMDKLWDRAKEDIKGAK